METGGQGAFPEPRGGVETSRSDRLSLVGGVLTSPVATRALPRTPPGASRERVETESIQVGNRSGSGRDGGENFRLRRAAGWDTRTMYTRSRSLRTFAAGVLLAALGMGASCEHTSERLERIRTAPSFPERTATGETAVESPPRASKTAGSDPASIDSLRGLDIDRSSRWSAVAAPADEEEM